MPPQIHYGIRGIPSSTTSFPALSFYYQSFEFVSSYPGITDIKFFSNYMLFHCSLSWSSIQAKDFSVLCPLYDEAPEGQRVVVHRILPWPKYSSSIFLPKFMDGRKDSFSCPLTIPRASTSNRKSLNFLQTIIRRLLKLTKLTLKNSWKSISRHRKSCWRSRISSTQRLVWCLA